MREVTDELRQQGYAKTAERELEATLLLRAAAQLQAVYDFWKDKPAGLNEALLYNRPPWTVFLDAVIREDNKLVFEVRQNLASPAPS